MERINDRARTGYDTKRYARSDYKNHKKIK